MKISKGIKMEILCLQLIMILQKKIRFRDDYDHGQIS